MIGLSEWTNFLLTLPLFAAAPRSPGRQNDAADREESPREHPLPDGSEDREPGKARERRFLATTAAFSYLIALLVGLVVIALIYANWT